MNPKWIETPFTYQFINLKSEDIDIESPELSFAVGGATQQGIQHKNDNQNNQDSISIFIDRDLIIGVLCDGCTGTHKFLMDVISNNEVGAKLFAYTVITNIQKLIQETNFDDFDAFIENLNQSLSRQLISLINILVSENEQQKEYFICDFLMTTVLGFVLTKEKYIIFGCGDGIYGTNDEINLLDKEEGYYFAKSILNECCPSKYPEVSSNNLLKIFNSGSTSELRNIFLATDGFYEIFRQFDSVLINMFKEFAPVRNGFDHLLFEFRKNILNNNVISEFTATKNWPSDDASFLLLRRTNTITPSHPETNTSNLEKNPIDCQELKNESINETR